MWFPRLDHSCFNYLREEQISETGVETEDLECRLGQEVLIQFSRISCIWEDLPLRKIQRCHPLEGGKPETGINLIACKLDMQICCPL